MDSAELADVATMFEAMADAGEVPAGARAEAVVGDALALPYEDGAFDVVIASEILEHVPADDAAIAELVRACCALVARWRSACHAGCPNASAGCSPTSTTPTRAAMCGSTRRPTARQDRVARPAVHPLAPRPRPALAVLVAGNALWELSRTRIPRWRRTTSCWSGT